MLETARQPNASAVRVDQTVHGYEHGHRLLASSRTFEGGSAQLMRAMSDLLTSRLLFGEESYLAGYPLKESTAYVLARTWAAPEMPRPGTVWTHSLIVDYPALTTLADPSVLIRLFRRPERFDLDRYRLPLRLPAGLQSTGEIDPAQHDEAPRAIANLYPDNPNRTVTIRGTSSAADEVLVLALWRQMWPALRRDTGFVTAAATASGTIDAGCIIRVARRQSGRIDPVPSSEPPLEVVAALLADLPERGPTELRAFIARHAFDMPRPRAAVAPLVRLWTRLSQSDLEASLETVQQLGSHAGSARLSRDIIGRVLAEAKGTDALVQLVRTFGDRDVSTGLDTLKNWLPKLSEPDLSNALEASAPFGSGSFGAQVFDAVAGNTPLELLADMDSGIETRLRLIAARPELLELWAFWPAEDSERAMLIPAASRAGMPLKAVAPMLTGAIGPQTIQALLETWPEQAPTALFDVLNTRPPQPALAEAIARSQIVTQVAVEAGGRLSPDRADELVRVALAAQSIRRPPQDFWFRLVDDGKASEFLSLAALKLAWGLMQAGPAARRAVTESFSAVHEATSRAQLPGAARIYLEAVMRDLHIFRWSLADCLAEAAIPVFEERGRVSPEVLALAGNALQLDSLIKAMDYKVGIAGVRELSHCADAAEGEQASWQAQRLRERLKWTRKSGWFW